ncbi:N-acetyltransferase family protein [Polaromonas sp.]|uniref:GNAT family N-acetyltransferase n=1 Tax=Polaromonas sp. TaxID=1869339 RepID=UPI003CB09171
MNIRAASSSDAEAIARVHVLGWQHAYAQVLPADFLSSLSIERRATMWAEAIEKQTQQLLVAEVEGEIVGFSAFGMCRDDDSVATDFEVWAIYLRASFLGTGAGRSLWLHSLSAMRIAGAKRATLWVLAENERAIRFYRAAGFAEDESSRKVVHIGGVSVDEIRYAQQIAG